MKVWKLEKQKVEKNNTLIHKLKTDRNSHDLKNNIIERKMPTKKEVINGKMCLCIHAKINLEHSKGRKKNGVITEILLWKLSEGTGE